MVAGFVTNPIDWKYSSAKNYAKDDTILKIANEGMHLGTLELWLGGDFLVTSVTIAPAGDKYRFSIQ